MATARKKKSRKFLWITDPWETLDHAHDTTLRLAQEAIALGHESYWCNVRSLFLKEGEVVIPFQKLKNANERDLKTMESLDQFDSVHYRTDPPVDLAYLHPLHLLALASSESPKTEVVNPLSVLFCSNEKLEGFFLKDDMAPSLVSSQWDMLAEFGKAEGRTVLKPLHEAQSKGVELLDWRSEDGIDHGKILIQTASSNFRYPVMLQRYLSGISEGELRLWYLDGKLLAHCKKLPLSGDFRVNMDRGSKLAKSKLSAAESKISARIGKHLKKKEVRLAAVDLIENKITDFNFTSPGLIPEMEKLLGENLSKIIIKELAQ